MDPLTFGIAFDQEFRSVTRGSPPLEIPLFRALQKTFQNLSKHFHIEEYHGTKSHVLFNGNGSWGRVNARCELADLMIIAFRKAPKLSIRLTFLQAKSERKNIPFNCGHRPSFRANLEQWDLLSRRPTISGYGNFNPPHSLLSGALLPTIGTFGFFYKDNNTDYQVYYSSADNLRLPPRKKPKNKYSNLQVKQGCMSRKVQNLPEMVSAGCNLIFGYGLFANLIGTPITHHWDKNTKGVTSETRKWLSLVLKKIVDESEANDLPASNARSLLDLLGNDEERDEANDSTSGVRSVVILRTDI